MLTWNRRDSTPLSAAPRAPKGDQGWIFGLINRGAIDNNYVKMIPIKDNYKFGTDPSMEDQIRRTNNWIYINDGH